MWLYFNLSVLGFQKGKRKGTVNICSQCSYTTPIMSHFKKHLLIHSGKRPFTCEICFKSFRQKEHLKSHSVVHLTQKCTFCRMTFFDENEFKSHMKNVHLVDV